jgi:hypothetical protein
VRDEHDGLVLEHAGDALLPDLGAHVRVHRGEHVVEQVDVRVGVDGAGQREPLLLPA